MARYKPDQGRMTRMATFWSLAAMLYYGCTSLKSELANRFDLGEPLGGLHIPVLGVDVSPAFLVAFVVFVGAMVLLFRWTEKPDTADVLIETESELKKVTWPTLPEVVNSSIVVVVSVLFLMGFLALTDWFIGRVTRVLLGI